MNHIVCRVSDILLVVVIYTAFSVEGAAVNHGESCAAATSNTCGETNNECVSDVCACTSGSFRNSDDNACVTKIALEGTCTADPAGQCVTTNAACHATDLVCKCVDTYFTDKNGACALQKTGLTTACDATDSATDQCAVTDSECRVDGTAQCLCKATHYTDSGACPIRKNPEDACTGDQCLEHATCDTTCKCDAGYTASPSTNPTMCSGVVKFASLSYMYVVPIIVSLMSLLR